jgi:hypothetical protein
VRRRPRITRARLRDLLHYDPASGEFRWREDRSSRIRAGTIAGSLTPERYRKITIKGRRYGAHQLAWFYMTGKWCSLVIDHRDGDPSNNGWQNLRPATRWQSNANRRLPRNNVSGLKGVSRHRSQWRARIRKTYRTHHLGIFSTRQAAHAAYAAAARKLFGEFARTE